MKTYIERMLRYTTWANGRTLAAAHGEAMRVLAHLLAAEAVWLARLERREAPLPVWPALTLDECDRLLAANGAGLAAVVAPLADEQFGNLIDYQNARGEAFQSTILEILTQVFTHGAYHRGQLAKILGRAGAAAPNTDFIMFTREVGD